MYRLITANRNYSSWSLRTWLLMKALDIPFEDVIEPFAASVNCQAFRRFSPTGQVPVLVDGGRTIWDSLGIALYLAERHSGVWPDDEAARAWAYPAVCENWREPSHEQELGAAGEIIADHRVPGLEPRPAYIEDRP